MDTTCSDIPMQPDPPLPVKVNHHSVELSWGTPQEAVTGANRPCYTVEMEDCSSPNGGFITVYR